jgi:predicted DCC family thiol-disulfide oxidoreductase YuxK
MPEALDLGDRLLVVYDGHCGLCNGWVRWLLRHDRLDRLRFAPSNSPIVAPLLANHPGLPDSNGDPGTILVFRNPFETSQIPLVRLLAILALLGQLPHPWPAFANVLSWIPGFLTDRAYRFIARWRYCIWGHLDTCPLPTAAERARFL